MTEQARTVQVPVSLIEHRWVYAYQERAGEISLRCSCGFAWKHIPLDHMRAANLPDCPDSQPTPTADSSAYQAGWNEGHTVGFDDGWGAGAAAARASGHDVNPGYDMPAEPPRIEDMAPGTTFSGNGVRRSYQYIGDGKLSEVDGKGVWWATKIDPSTIRDVTPPAGA